MTLDLDTRLTARYAFRDDRVAAPRRIGTPPALSGAEPLCPAVAQALLG